MVTIICPRTGQRVPTGVVMNREEFERAPSVPNVVRCAACGRVHQWTKQDAELLESDPDSPPGTGRTP
ncbi:MAG TPA: hypothetical protein VHX52_00220 [Steroidobacteraceae bacterium]|jgi:uncharacterized Zn finger protein|nr:hypothetical protein [Steroidobacteraceae bacterium]